MLGLCSSKARDCQDGPARGRLCDVFGVTLDWIFSGNIAQLPADLLERLQRGEAPDADPVDPKSVPEIGNRLASLRTNFNKTPAEMAGIIGTRRPDVWKEYEHGLRKIRMGHAERLCEEFEVSLDWIYLGDIKRLPIHLRKQLRPERTPRTDAHSTAGSEGI